MVKDYVSTLKSAEKEKYCRKRGTKTALMVHISKNACARERKRGTKTALMVHISKDACAKE